MPIPRLKRSSDDPSATGSSNSEQNKHRVTHACEPCRQRKTKCSGERPVCKHCEDFNISCLYEDGKRDRTRKEYNSMAARVSEYEALLQDISDRVGEGDQSIIQRALNNDNQDTYNNRDDSSNASSSRARYMVDGVGKESMADGVGKEPMVDGVGRKPMVDGLGENDFGTERQVPGRKGSTESVDCVNEDLNRTAESRATGFMGKNTEINWLGQLRERTDHSDETQGESEAAEIYFGSGLDGMSEKGRADHTISESTYHCDDVSLDVADRVQAHQLPPKAIADLLLSCYLESVHPAFPIVGKTTFMKQYQAYYSNPALQTGPLWLAILNLLFAIAARYSRLARAEWITRAEDEHVYFSRARLLGLGADTLWVHGELQRIQVAGLTSFYLMGASQINRAFVMNGIAVRQALTLGLHLRNDDRKLADSSKEIRYRVWWAIAVTERTLSVMTGRPTSFVGSDCSAPLPVPLDEASFMLAHETYKTSAVNKLRRTSTGESQSTDVSFSTSSSMSSRHKSPSDISTVKSPSSVPDADNVAPNIGLFFLYIAKLSNLNDDVLKQIYRPPILDSSWASVQARRAKCHERLERWRMALPPIFDFTRSQQDYVYARARMCLAFSYYSTVIITNRPFLCKMERRIPNESARGRGIDQTNAVTCVYAARSVIDILPDRPNVVGMYQETPWWNMVHHLMQAITVLMLELSLSALHCPESGKELLHAAEKGVRWLQAMAPDDMAASRAWKLSSELLGKVATRVGGKMDDRLRWPVLLDQDVPMGPPTQDGLGPSGYYPPSSMVDGDYTGYEPVTTWEPLMFTSYDNYLFGSNNDPSTGHGQPQHRWN
ncbi:MAG: hypothetical protein Q9168_008006 [Polycauliona sp. 1 TL-2023]